MEHEMEHAIEHGNNLAGGAEEWLRRMALNQSPAIAPEAIAFALVACGFAERAQDGSFAATTAGRAYLEARGIETVVVRRKRT
jgi:hypothetical protein